MSDALGTSADRRTALAHFVLQMSPHDAALLQQALDQGRPRPDAGRPRPEAGGPAPGAGGPAPGAGGPR